MRFLNKAHLSFYQISLKSFRIPDTAVRKNPHGLCVLHFVDKSNQYRKGCKNIIRHQQENGKCFSHERRKIRIEKTGCTTQCSPLVDGRVAMLPPILLLLISPARSAVLPGSSCRRACPCRERRHGHQSRKCSSDDTS